MGRAGPRRGPEQVEKDARAVQLRKSHLTYTQIAQELGYVNRQSAYDAVKRGLADSVFETNDEVRQQELERYDDLSRRALGILAAKHYKTAGKDLVQHPVTKEYLLDATVTLKAIDTLLKIMAQRADLLGIKAPVQVEMITMSAVDAEINRLSGLLRAHADEPVGDGQG